MTSPRVPPYIPPRAKLHATREDAAAYLDRPSAFQFDGVKNEPLALSSLRGVPRLLVVGDPGVGKTRFLQELRIEIERDGASVASLALREGNCVHRIEHVLSAALPTTLLLDGLDEAPHRELLAIVRTIDELSRERPDLRFILSSRWVFAQRYANELATFRILTIAPFSIRQARTFLVSAGVIPADVDLLQQRLSLGHPTIALQIPRYLEYLAEYVRKHGVDNASNLSRNDLFEHWIYQKLDLEDRKRGTYERALFKRVLEQLALAMEIYQRNSITMDELVTFFDAADSEIARQAMPRLGLSALLESSVLRVTGDGLDRVEFDNVEFQEYLAAKEIARAPDPQRTAFGFAVDRDRGEIRPSWYNTLTFLVDLQPALLKSIVDFSGLNRGDTRVIEESFFAFLGRVDPRSVVAHDRTPLFRNLIDYHARTRQWISYKLSRLLSNLSDRSTDAWLQAKLVSEPDDPSDRYMIPQANVALVVAWLLEGMVDLERAFWRGKLVALANDRRANGVLQRKALAALTAMHDPTVVAELFPPVEDELVRRVFVQSLIEIDPDHPRTIDAVIDSVVRGELEGREGLYAFTRAESAATILRCLAENGGFLRALLVRGSIHRRRDLGLTTALDKVLDAADADAHRLVELATTALHACIAFRSGHDADEAPFVHELWRTIARRDPNFTRSMLRELTVGPRGHRVVWHIAGLLAAILTTLDLPDFVELTANAGEKNAAMFVFDRMPTTGRSDAASIYASARELMADSYAAREAAQREQTERSSHRTPPGRLQDLRELLETSSGERDAEVFEYFNADVEELRQRLDIEDERRLRVRVETFLAREDPRRYPVSARQTSGGAVSFSWSSKVGAYQQAVVTARHMHVDLGPYRRQVLGLIPFVVDDFLITIFEAVPRVQSHEFVEVMRVYAERDSALWRLRPGSFIEAAGRYHLPGTAPILRQLANEPMIDAHDRVHAVRPRRRLRQIRRVPLGNRVRLLRQPEAGALLRAPRGAGARGRTALGPPAHQLAGRPCRQAASRVPGRVGPTELHAGRRAALQRRAAQAHEGHSRCRRVVARARRGHRRGPTAVDRRRRRLSLPR